MKTFSLNTVTQAYALRVCEAIERNKGYIIYFNKGAFKEAVQRIFMAAMREEKTEYTNLDPYIKVLARNVMKSHARDIPYAPYNEEGEVSLVFTPLVDNPMFDDFDNKSSVLDALKEIYLTYPEDFMLLAQLVPDSDPKDVQGIIKNKELSSAIMHLVADFDSQSVFYGIIEFVSQLAREKAEAVNALTGCTREVQLIPYNTAILSKLDDKRWLLDRKGRPVGINRSTLLMENDFNPEFYTLKLAIKTVCTIWRVDLADFLNMIETKVYVEQGVDNEFILWCGDKYKLTTPAGKQYIGITRETYMDLVRREIVVSLINAELGTVIATGPESVYLRLTKATNLSNIHFKADKNRTYILPMEAQKKVVCCV